MAPKAPKTVKKLLMPTGASHAPIIMEKRFWTETFIVKDYFWAQVEKNRTEADVPFEHFSVSSGSAALRDHQTPFMDHKEGEGIIIHPRSVLRMRVEKGEVCWSDIDFEAKSQTNASFGKWATALMARKEYSGKIVSAGVGRALNLSKNLFINRSPMDFEFLFSRWSTESHTFVTAWGEFCPTLEDVVVLTGLPLFGGANTIVMPRSSNLILDKDDKVRLILLNEALSNSKAKRKSTYTTWVNYFTDGVGARRVAWCWKLSRILAILVHIT